MCGKYVGGGFSEYMLMMICVVSMELISECIMVVLYYVC